MAWGAAAATATKRAYHSTVCTSISCMASELARKTTSTCVRLLRVISSLDLIRSEVRKPGQHFACCSWSWLGTWDDWGFPKPFGRRQEHRSKIGIIVGSDVCSSMGDACTANSRGPLPSEYIQACPIKPPGEIMQSRKKCRANIVLSNRPVL